MVERLYLIVDAQAHDQVTRIKLRILKKFQLEESVTFGGTKGTYWMFDIDYLSDLRTIFPCPMENQANHMASNSEESNMQKNYESRTSSKNSKKEDSSTDSLEDNSKIHGFRRDHTINAGRLDHDDSLMPELEIFHKPETGIFDEASYDKEGVITDFNSFPTEIEVSPTPTHRLQ
ncbi:hypothetical protein Tco_1449827 [Tanacetum coccineum]